MTVAIFPGSFDPITNGHLDIATKAAKAFDELYIVIMDNTNKKYFFCREERVAFIEDAVKDIKNIKVITRPEQLTVAVAKELNATVMVRGLRNNEDFIYEQQIANMNKKLAPDLETALFFASPENASVSSSMVKEIAKFGGDVRPFLPKLAATAMIQRLNNE